LEAAEHERASIAEGLRGETAQILATVLIGLTAVNEAGDLSEVRAMVGELRAAVRADLERVQALASRLRPSVLDDFGLAAALQSVAKQASAETGLPFEIALPEFLPGLERREQDVIFRILEEAIGNAPRHAGVNQVRVSFSRLQGEMRFEVTDDGSGVDVPVSDSNYRAGGLALMQAQAGAVGGRLEVHSREGIGTRVILRLPWERVNE
jgi:two-component system sensor histidine kinase UhpB